MPDNRSNRNNLLQDFEENLQRIKNDFGNSEDLQVRKIEVGKGSFRCAFLSIDGLVNSKSINDLIDSLIFESKNMMMYNEENMWEQFAQVGGTVSNVTEFHSLNMALLSGQTILLPDKSDVAYAISTEGWETRGIQESQSESVIRGPRDSFTENLRTNTALIRRKIKDPSLRMKTTPLGRVTQTNVTLVFIDGIVNKKVLAKIEKRLQQIDIDGILEGGYIEEFIQDKKTSIFPTVYSTERPDVTAAGILEGRVAILVDGTPFVMLAPALFVQFFQAAEDYYLSPMYSLVTRFLRYVAFCVFLLATSIYIAATSFHQELVPTKLLISFATQRENVPFPVFVEALLLMFTYEVLREAIIRMPKAVGSAVSIVGALVLGSAAIEAGFVSGALVIVVAIEAVASFILPTSISTPIRLIRFAFVVMASTFGLLGIFICLMLLFIHMCSIESFGVSYMSPLTPFNVRDQKDTFVRFPVSFMHKRPKFIAEQNIVRQSTRGGTK